MSKSGGDFKFPKTSHVHSYFLQQRTLLKSCTRHSSATAMLCAKFQTNLLMKMDIICKYNNATYAFKDYFQQIAKVVTGSIEVDISRNKISPKFVLKLEFRGVLFIWNFIPTALPCRTKHGSHAIAFCPKFNTLSTQKLHTKAQTNEILWDLY